MSKSPGRNYNLIVLPALIVVFLDQISKLAIVHTIRLHEFVPVLKGFLNLVHVRNRGMAFGLMNRPDIEFGFYFLAGASLAAIFLLLLWFSKLKAGDSRIVLGISLILGGAIGNLIDRLRFREVIDFLDFYIGSYHWPAFNLADSSITGGTFWILIILIFQRKEMPKVS